MSGVTDASAVMAARGLGEAAGKAAASWVFDGNTTTETYQEALRMIEDGDSLIDGWILEPHWLGGLYDYPTPASLGDELGIELALDPWTHDAVCTAYEEAASEAFWADVESFARRMVEDWT